MNMASPEALSGFAQGAAALDRLFGNGTATHQARPQAQATGAMLPASANQVFDGARREMNTWVRASAWVSAVPRARGCHEMPDDDTGRRDEPREDMVVPGRTEGDIGSILCRFLPGRNGGYASREV
jgi:hypothetical protein